MTEVHPRTEHMVDHRGARLYAVEAGSGDPLILFHGGLANHQACWLFAAPLAARFRVITPDLRGSGRSHFAGPLSWDLLADDVAALARELGIERAVVGGTSFGAGLAVRVALRHRALVRGLVVLNPAYGGAAHGFTAAQSAAMNAMDAAGSRAVAEGVDVLLPLFDALPDEIRERARALVRTYDAASVATSTRFMASAAQPFERGDELAAMDVPALLVPGLDPTHPREVADVYRRHLPRVTVTDCDPSGYAEAITRWWSW
ncbi:MAG TPA: alpha/beta hydrolase [Kofleriaceae bacterium]|nr:alpha/beta hydrolase [Kofleriaceae bacterium]